MEIRRAKNCSVERGGSCVPEMTLRNSIGYYCFILVCGAITTVIGVIPITLDPVGSFWWMTGILWILIFGAVTIGCGVALFDRSVKVRVDQSGIHDLRPPGKSIAWKQVVDIKLVIVRTRRGRTELVLRMDDGSEDTIDVTDLDSDWRSLHENTVAIWKTAQRRDPSEPNPPSPGSGGGAAEPSAAADRPRD
jgi:hypothetical protein